MEKKKSNIGWIIIVIILLIIIGGLVTLLLKEKGITPNSERRLYIFKQWCRSNNINIR